MNIFQTPEWERFKLSTGYQKSYRIDNVLVLQKSLPMGRTMLYTPMINQSQISNLKSQITSDKFKSITKNSKAIFYRAEFDVISQQSNNETMKQLGFLKAFEEMQPEHTLLLDISKSEDEILNQMKPKGRYNIKVAEKNGVKIIEDNSTDNFFGLYSTMARRHKISYRGAKYFQNLFDILGTKGYCKVFTARVPEGTLAPYESTNQTKLRMANQNPPNDQSIKQPTNKSVPIASVIISFYNNRATYLFGGSSDNYRNLMAPYLLQWTAIREAKKHGCTEYDFFGIAPTGVSNHPWRGVTDFKKKFGGREVELLGSWDLILRPMEYKLFEIAEKLRR